MHAGEGLVVEQVLADPIIVSPLDQVGFSRSFVGRGYRQYPDPVGLKVVSRDPFLALFTTGFRFLHRIMIKAWIAFRFTRIATAMAS
ncbi:MAG: hypothetical protein R3B96_24330 [Pirellulaceae bacterium]